jgi:ribosomal protein S18 acetylase RimI-like enzyme
MDLARQASEFLIDGIPYVVTAMTGMDDIREAFDTLRMLRPNCKDVDAFVEQICRLQRTSGYRLYAARNTSALVVGVVGFRFMENLMHGRHIYVDDLVILPEFRGIGIGGELLQFAIAQALAERCDRVLLDTGIDNEAAARFYINLGFKITAHRFTMVPDQ